MMSGSPAVAAVYDRRQYSNLRDRRRSFLEAARYRACASRTAATVAILDFLCKADDQDLNWSLRRCKRESDITRVLISCSFR